MTESRAGEALLDLKQEPFPSFPDIVLTQYEIYNIYGDPSIAR